MEILYDTGTNLHTPKRRGNLFVISETPEFSRITMFIGWSVSCNTERKLTTFMFEPRSGHMGFVVDKVALEKVFSKYFLFPYKFSFHRLLHIHHPGLVQ
jgi:hypothetical protein